MTIDTSILLAHLSLHKRFFGHGLQCKVFYNVGNGKDNNAAEDRGTRQVYKHIWMAFDVGGNDYRVYLKQIILTYKFITRLSYLRRYVPSR